VQPVQKSRGVFFATNPKSAELESNDPEPRMKREYPETPLVGVGAIIIEGDRVALVKRGRPPLAGQWSIPGGLLEVGETLRACAEREVREETGLTVSIGELLGVFDRVVPDADGQIHYHYVLIDFLCPRTAGELSPADDAEDARWFTREDVAALNLAPETFKVIVAGFEKTTAGAP
jgi:8-oxo-dGTP diphosphatase